MDVGNILYWYNSWRFFVIIDVQADNTQLKFWCLSYGKAMSEMHCPRPQRDALLLSRLSVIPVTDMCEQKDKWIKSGAGLFCHHILDRTQYIHTVLSGISKGSCHNITFLVIVTIIEECANSYILCRDRSWIPRKAMARNKQQIRK